VIRDPYGADLVAWGKALELTTRGRVSGHPAVAVIGFAEDPDGSLLVAAGDPEANWAANLRAEPSCSVRIGDVTLSCVAHELDGPTRSRAVVSLILKYGTPAESLGAGPAFRLQPAGRGPDAPSAPPAASLED
jgi:deazaflavin-dependent oxidoreductase (nitroreductase family)